MKKKLEHEKSDTIKEWKGVENLIMILNFNFLLKI